MKAAVFVEPGKMEVREVARPGAVVGRVGVPHTGDINIGGLLDGQLGNGWWTSFLYNL